MTNIVGADAYIRPWYPFILSFAQRVDVGIDPYKFSRMAILKHKKTGDPEGSPECLAFIQFLLQVEQVSCIARFLCRQLLPIKSYRLNKMSAVAPFSS